MKCKQAGNAAVSGIIISQTNKYKKIGTLFLRYITEINCAFPISYKDFQVTSYVIKRCNSHKYFTLQSNKL